MASVEWSCIEEGDAVLYRDALYRVNRVDCVKGFLQALIANTQDIRTVPLEELTYVSDDTLTPEWCTPSRHSLKHPQDSFDFKPPQTKSHTVSTHSLLKNEVERLEEESPEEDTPVKLPKRTGDW